MSGYGNYYYKAAQAVKLSDSGILMNEIISKAIKDGHRALSEYDSKRILYDAGVPVTREKLAFSREEALRFTGELGYPVALKGSGHNVTHKTEMGLVKLNIMDEGDLFAAYDDIVNKGADIEGVLVQEMISGEREFIIGLTRDPQFGPCVMFGLGGIFAEVLKDVSFRIAPLTESDAEEMISEIRTHKLLEEFRNSPPVNKQVLINALIGVGNLGLKYDEIAEIDINPLIISDGNPVAVDGLVILSDMK